jgi:hypothetical protein
MPTRRRRSWRQAPVDECTEPRVTIWLLFSGRQDCRLHTTISYQAKGPRVAPQDAILQQMRVFADHTR